MSLGEAVAACFARYAVFSGRARRAEYWWFVLFGVLVSLAAGVLDGAMGYELHQVSPLSALLSLALLLPQLAVTARRLHDTGRSGWWMLLGLVPLVGTIILIVWTATRGEPGPNRFGPDPLDDAPPPLPPDDVPLTPSAIPRVPRRR
jgi:uncharacterized membrane protein YhaH (DUF805 family)